MSPNGSSSQFKPGLDLSSPDLINKHCIVYLVVIYSFSWDDLLQALRLVLERIQMQPVKMKQKYFFGSQEITNLGHMVTEKGNKPLPETIQAI